MYDGLNFVGDGIMKSFDVLGTTGRGLSVELLEGTEEQYQELRKVFDLEKELSPFLNAVVEGKASELSDCDDKFELLEKFVDSFSEVQGEEGLFVSFKSDRVIFVDVVSGVVSYYRCKVPAVLSTDELYRMFIESEDYRATRGSKGYQFLWATVDDTNFTVYSHHLIYALANGVDLLKSVYGDSSSAGVIHHLDDDISNNASDNLLLVSRWFNIKDHYLKKSGLKFSIKPIKSSYSSICCCNEDAFSVFEVIGSGSINLYSNMLIFKNDKVILPIIKNNEDFVRITFKPEDKVFVVYLRVNFESFKENLCKRLYTFSAVRFDFTGWELLSQPSAPAVRTLQLRDYWKPNDAFDVVAMILSTLGRPCLKEEVK